MDAPAVLLTLVATIPLPGVDGRIDHLSADPKRNRLFVAALANNTVEVVDLKAGQRIRSLGGFEKPQGVLFLPKNNRLVVANGGNGRVDVLDAAAGYVPLTRLHFKSDADNIRFDPFTDEVLIGHGDGAVAILDAGTGIERRHISLPAHPESFQLLPQERLLFINLPEAAEIAVADPDRMQIVSHWPNPEGQSTNHAMAVDPEQGRVFVAYRTPARLATLQAKSGKMLSNIELCGDSDDLFYDLKFKRLYSICGDGFVDVFDAGSPGKERRIARISTAPHARTGLFVRESGRLIVAVPAQGGRKARLLVFKRS